MSTSIKSIQKRLKEREARIAEATPIFCLGEKLAHDLAYRLSKNDMPVVPINGIIYDVHPLTANNFRDDSGRTLGLVGHILVPKEGSTFFITFRGTDLKDPASVQRDFESEAGYTIYELCKNSILIDLNKHFTEFAEENPGRKIEVTFAGHSLGGVDAQRTMILLMERLGMWLAPDAKKDDQSFTLIHTLNLFTANSPGVCQETHQRAHNAVKQVAGKIKLNCYHMRAAGDGIQQAGQGIILSDPSLHDAVTVRVVKNYHPEVKENSWNVAYNPREAYEASGHTAKAHRAHYFNIGHEKYVKPDPDHPHEWLFSEFQEDRPKIHERLSKHSNFLQGYAIKCLMWLASILYANRPEIFGNAKSEQVMQAVEDAALPLVLTPWVDIDPSNLLTAESDFAENKMELPRGRRVAMVDEFFRNFTQSAASFLPTDLVVPTETMETIRRLTLDCVEAVFGTPDISMSNKIKILELPGPDDLSIPTLTREEKHRPQAESKQAPVGEAKKSPSQPAVIPPNRFCLTNANHKPSGRLVTVPDQKITISPRSLQQPPSRREEKVAAAGNLVTARGQKIPNNPRHLRQPPLRREEKVAAADPQRTIFSKALGEAINLLKNEHKRAQQLAASQSKDIYLHALKKVILTAEVQKSKFDKNPRYPIEDCQKWVLNRLNENIIQNPDLKHHRIRGTIVARAIANFLMIIPLLGQVLHFFLKNKIERTNTPKKPSYFFSLQTLHECKAKEAAEMLTLPNIPSLKGK